MELLILFLLAAVIHVLVTPAVTLHRTGALKARIDELEKQIWDLRRQLAPKAVVEPKVVASAKTAEADGVMVRAAEKVPEAVASVAPESGIGELPGLVADVPVAQTEVPGTAESEREAVKLPPPLPISVANAAQSPTPEPVVTKVEPEKKEKPGPDQSAGRAVFVREESSFSWEQFVGAKLFAWVGGLALFFGIVFFVKYAFENNQISPAVRVAMGYVTAAGLMLAGFWFRMRQAYRVLTQTLSATGILAFYGVTYAAHAWYRFPVFSMGLTFFLMACITALAFVTAVRANAVVVAVLGLLGGFLTPFLLATGENRLLLLFGYLALLNAGLVGLSWRQGWWRLLPLASAATALIIWNWWLRFYALRVLVGGEVWEPVLVLGGFALGFAAVARVVMRRFGRVESGGEAVLAAGTAAVVLGAAGVLLAFRLLEINQLGCHPLALYTLVLMLSTCWWVAGWYERRLIPFGVGGCLLVMLHLALWMNQHLTDAHLLLALGLNLLFGGLHLWYLGRVAARAREIPQLEFTFGVMSLVMLGVTSLPIFLLEQTSWLLWPPFLLCVLAALAVAVLGAAVWLGIAAVLLSLGTLWYWLQKLASGGGHLSEFLWVLGLLVLCLTAGGFLVQRLLTLRRGDLSPVADEVLRWVQMAAFLMPFLLLAGVPGMLPQQEPHVLLAAALALTLSAVWWSRSQARVVAAAWMGWLLVALAWLLTDRQHDGARLLTLWLLLVPVLASGLLLLNRRFYREAVEPYAAGLGLSLVALALLRGIVEGWWPGWTQLLVPLGLGMVWAGHGLFLQREKTTAMQQTAWVWAVALAAGSLSVVFIRDWYWLSLALALFTLGLALLYRHCLLLPLLLLAAVTGLLAGLLLVRPVLELPTAAFAGMPGWLWVLIGHGGSLLALLGAAVLIPQTQGMERFPMLVEQVERVRGWLYGLAVLTAFTMLNLWIAIGFDKGLNSAIWLKVGESFAADMTYSIAWALFAILLLGIGLRFRSLGARRAGVLLLLLTLIKLFVHDLARVGSVYRIIVFLGVAVIALTASFLYQRAAQKVDP